MARYPLKNLSEICKITTGKHDANHAEANGKYRFYTCASQYCYCNTKSFSGEAVIVPGNGDIGLVFYYNGDFDAYQRTYVLTDITINAKYLYYHLLHKWRYINSSKQFGSTVKYVRMANFTSYNLTVPPLPEQERIVAKIEELFSQLDAAVAELKSVKEKLAIYRQAVLKEAFEGNVYQQDSICKIIDFADVQTGSTPLTSRADFYGGPIPWISSGKVNEEKIYEPSDWITELALKETNCKIFPAHTILVAMYGEGKTRGKCAELMIASATNQALAAIILNRDSCIIKDFLLWFLKYNYQKLRIMAAGGVQPNLNLTAIKNIEIPLFAKNRQERIVMMIEEKLSVCNNIEQTVDTALQQAAALRQSILKQAFEGNL